MPNNPDNIAQSKGDSKEKNRVGRLVQRLGSSDTRQRERAECGLRTMGVDALEPLLAVVANEAKAARRRRIWQVFNLVVLGLLVGDMIWTLFHHGLSFRDFRALVLCSFAFILGGCFMRRPIATMRQRSLVNILADIDDPRAVGLFAEALAFTHSEDKLLHKVANVSLIRLLPQLRASDGHLLNDKQRTHLRLALSGKDKPLTLAILKAWEQIGDIRDLPFVEKIDSPDAEVMEAARACVPFLLARAEQQKVSQTLLRASDIDSTTSVVLLRAATGHESLEPQTLLRAVSSQGDNQE